MVLGWPPCKLSWCIFCCADGLRRRLGIPTGDVLDVLASWPEKEQAEGNRILAEVEDGVSVVTPLPLTWAGIQG